MGNQETRQRVQLAEPIRGAAKGALRRGTDLFAEYRQAELPSTYVPISPERMGAFGALQMPGQQYQPAYDAWSDIVGGSELDVANNPYFNTIVSRAVGQAMAPVASQFATYGGGPGRDSIGGYLASEIGAQTAAGLYGDWYQQAANRRQQAIQQAPLLEQMQYADAMRQMGVGTEMEADVARQQQEELRQFTYPLQLLQQEQQMLASSPLAGESRTTVTQPFNWGGFFGTLGLTGAQGLAGGFANRGWGGLW